MRDEEDERPDVMFHQDRNEGVDDEKDAEHLDYCCPFTHEFHGIFMF